MMYRIRSTYGRLEDVVATNIEQSAIDGLRCFSFFFLFSQALFCHHWRRCRDAEPIKCENRMHKICKPLSKEGDRARREEES